MVLQLLQKPDEALTLHREEERISRRLGNLPVVAHALFGQAGILFARGQFQEALSLCQEQEQICRAIGHTEGLVDSLLTQGFLFGKALNLPDKAMGLALEAQRLASENGLLPRVDLASRLLAILHGG